MDDKALPEPLMPAAQAPHDPVSAWRSEFGDAYVDRNLATSERIAAYRRALGEILGHIPANSLTTVLEVGCNVGLNLRALRQLVAAELFAVEPNEKARSIVLGDQVLPPSHLHDATADKLPFSAHSMDLVFTGGVLIHIHPDSLDAVYREIHRVSRRYILAMEYFAREPVMIPYRGRDNMLFKRDFGAFWLDLFPELTCVGNGFFWQRTTGLDDVTWWLFEKPGRR